MTHNHKHFQQRLEFIKNLLSSRLGFMGDAEINPIQYDPDCPFKYNNFVYRVSVPSEINRGWRARSEVSRPGCTVIPDGTREFIVRLTNSAAEGLNPQYRVENEVAMLQLTAAAVANVMPHVVPAVYDWGSAASSAQGWILQEFMTGTPMDEAFVHISRELQQQLLAQMARLLRALQTIELPPSIAGLGGVTFGVDGQLVSAPLPMVEDRGPWQTLEAMYQERFQLALKLADDNVAIQGWRANGIRLRLDAFLEQGLVAKIGVLGFKETRNVVHGDFTMNNVLVDVGTGRITALLDYDFAHICHPSCEFFTSFGDVGGLFHGWTGDDGAEETMLRDAQLHGFSKEFLHELERGDSWWLAKIWDGELEGMDVLRPRTIEGISEVADVEALLSAVLPWRITNPDKLSMLTSEETAKSRAEGEQRLSRLLDHLSKR